MSKELDEMAAIAGMNREEIQRLDKILADRDACIVFMKSKIAKLEEECENLKTTSEMAEHDRDDARGERDRVSQEANRLHKGIIAAMDYASHRWSEWGSRALCVAEILDAALENREPELD